MKVTSIAYVYCSVVSTKGQINHGGSIRTAVERDKKYTALKDKEKILMKIRYQSDLKWESQLTSESITTKVYSSYPSLDSYLSFDYVNCLYKQ